MTRPLTRTLVSAGVVLALGLGALSLAVAQAQKPRREFHVSRTAHPPVIDGKLTDEVWSAAEVLTEFTQQDPDEGQPATERTEIRLLYDDQALYVGAHLFDHEAARVSRRLATRDSDGDADRIVVYLDPMHDRLTGAMFQVTASNVQTDGVLYNDTWNDWSWDAVWQSRVSIDADGWSVEMRIPLSQLRFTSAEHQTWGLNISRFIRRKNENVWLEMVPKNETGLVSRMADLTGFDGLKPARRLELLPYTASRAEFINPQGSGNPFNDGSRLFGSAGLDMKWGLTSNLTVDATVNPDFGQVEVDPAVVNLSAFETFFPEKRAFFLEGAQIFGNFGRLGSNSFWGFNNSEPQIFYSRRIGRSPQLQASGDFVDPPRATTILGAAKLTGKTGGGWSIGLLEAITSREMAHTSTGFTTSEALVEPFSSYAVARVQHDIGRRAGIGFLATSTTRQLDDPAARNELVGGAYVGGGDGFLFLDQKKDWVITGDLAASRVNGSRAAITPLQLAPQRYYQRPDAPHVTLDPSATSMSGYSGRINLNRNSGLVQVNAALWGVSPGFESNDLGFHTTGDRAGAHGVIIWRNVTPGNVIRSRTIWLSKFWVWNFNREIQNDGTMVNANATFLNYWNVGANAVIDRRALDDRLTRGGPLAENAADRNISWNIGSDGRKTFSMDVNNSYSWNVAGGWSRNLGLNFNVKPADGITLSLGPEWNRSYGIAQYVRTVVDPTATDTYGGRYVFSGIDQWQLAMTTRANVIFTPHVSLQVFMQPLLATGDYNGFKELARPRTLDFLHYGDNGSSLAFDAMSQTYTADPDGAGPAPPFRFGNPDYNFKSLRLNAVFRWEMRPGSNFYAVWTRQQQDLSNPGIFAPGRDVRAMFGAEGDDVILFKVAYWIGR
jgi:hypothetical protein